MGLQKKTKTSRVKLRNKCSSIRAKPGPRGECGS
ncbi:rCG50136 [Rattus norvegicus]|uniref:RCG50136 n=1 Tax=Rattus norvegicus TaxID=10116 RepID=A6JVA5_RAT|nr:rCG50136 [Rattus norvegicus]